MPAFDRRKSSFYFAVTKERFCCSCRFTNWRTKSVETSKYTDEGHTCVFVTSVHTTERGLTESHEVFRGLPEKFLAGGWSNARNTFDWSAGFFRRNQDGVGRRGCARFVYFSFLSIFQKLSLAVKDQTGHDVDESRSVCLVVWFGFALLQNLVPCLPSVKAVSWTTNFGFAMMQSSISLVETSIPLSLQVAFILKILSLKLFYHSFLSFSKFLTLYAGSYNTYHPRTTYTDFLSQINLL